MTDKKPAVAGQVDKAEEAKHLAKEAVEELQHGNKEEGRFLAQEAKDLDHKAAAEVLKDQEGSPKGGKKKSG